MEKDAFVAAMGIGFRFGNHDGICPYLEQLRDYHAHEVFFHDLFPFIGRYGNLQFETSKYLIDLRIDRPFL